MVYILPYIEQNALASRWVFSNGLNPAGPGSGANQSGPNPNYDLVHNVTIPTYRGPTSPLPKSRDLGPINNRIRNASGQPATVMIASYVGVAGASNEALTGVVPASQQADKTRQNNDTPASGCCDGGHNSGGGVLFANSAVPLNRVADGTSTTLLVGEQSDWIEFFGRKVEWTAQLPESWSTGVNGPGSPPTYRGAANCGGCSDYRMPNTTTVRYLVNKKVWGPADGTVAGFTPPTATTDLFGMATWPYQTAKGIAASASNIPLNSAHPGGAVAALCDGSVRFLADNTPIRTLALLALRDDRIPIAE